MRKVFISHKGTDSYLAGAVALRVQKNGLSTYLDVIDDALIKDGPDLSDHIRARMSECDKLIAVVSDATKHSWWVPWEIGVGAERDFRMASYSEKNVGLPSFLRKWLELHSATDIDLYCQYIKITESNMESIRGRRITELGKMYALQQQVRSFHKDLMRDLSRRY